MAAAATPLKRWWLLGLAALALSIAGFSHFVSFSLRGQQPDSGADADRDEGRTVVAFGHVDSEFGIASLHPIHPGRVAEVLVREGDAVPANAVMLRMVDDLPKARADEARIALESAQSELADARIKLPEKHRLDVQKQSLAVEVAKNRRGSAEIAYKHKQKLAATSGVGVSETEVALAKQDFESAQALVQVEESALSQLRLIDPAAEIRKLEAGVQRLDAAHRQAQADLASYTLKAPRAGTVLRISCSPGDTLGPTPQLPAIEFCPDGNRNIRAEIEQAYAGAVAVGQRVIIEDGSNAPGRWTGRVVRVADWYARKRSVIAEPGQFNDVRTLDCIIAIDPGQPALRINQRVQVTIQVGSR